MQFQNARLLHVANSTAPTERILKEHAYYRCNLRPQALILKPCFKPLYIQSITFRNTIARVRRGYDTEMWSSLYTVFVFSSPQLQNAQLNIN